MENGIFAQRLKQLRKNQGLSQEELGNVLDVSKVMVSYYENNLRMPSNSTLRQIARYFNVSTDYLLGLDEIEEIDLDPRSVDATLLKIIRRYKKLSSFLLEAPRSNPNLLESMIDQLKTKR